MSLPYYKFYPRDFFEGTQRMSLELKGAYIMLLNLIYTRNGPVDDEEGYIARYIGCSIRKWQKLRLELIGLGKITVSDGLISNSRADEELIKRTSYVDQKRENRSGSKENKAQEKRPSTYTEPDTDTEVVSRVVFARGELSDVSESDLNELEANCRKWANGSLAERAGPLILGPIIRLLKPNGGTPCTLDDVREGITKSAASLHAQGKRVGTLSYFEKPILAARDERLRPNPEPEKTHERAGQGQSGRRANDRGNLRAGAGGKHGSSAFAVAQQRLFGGDQAQADLPDEPLDGRAEWVA